MIGGRHRRAFWAGIALTAGAVIVAFMVGLRAAGSVPGSGAAAAVLALAGLLAYEHAYVQAGQAVPLA
jgi:uncharacterized membrane protein YhaH (DUF805 family)